MWEGEDLHLPSPLLGEAAVLLNGLEGRASIGGITLPEATMPSQRLVIGIDCCHLISLRNACIRTALCSHPWLHGRGWISLSFRLTDLHSNVGFASDGYIDPSGRVCYSGSNAPNQARQQAQRDCRLSPSSLSAGYLMPNFSPRISNTVRTS